MPYPIEILAIKEDLYKSIEVACESLNKVQNEFLFCLPNTRLRNSAFLEKANNYKTTELFDWLRKYRSTAGGNRPYIMLVVDGGLASPKLANLFGSHEAVEGLAIFTINNFDQFVNDITRFCRYYIVRYTLSFFAPEIKAHDDTRDCVFDKKLNKKDLLLSLASGRICDECRNILRPKLNPEIDAAIESLLKVVSNQYPYSIVLKGGGVKGLAFAGALLELENYFSFDAFAGTSAGAIASVLLGAGYKPQELLEILAKKNFNDFKDAPTYKLLFNFFWNGGLYPGEEIENWIATLLKNKIGKIGNVEMRDLPSQTIVYACKGKSGSFQFDSLGDRRESPAAFAARCSMSIPYYFFPQSVEGERTYDGGIKNNFPLKRFVDNNKQKPFIGLYLNSNIKKEKFVFMDLYNIATVDDELKLVDENISNIVTIDVDPIGAIDFDLSEQEKEFLVLAGRVSALSFIEKNHPSITIDKINLLKLSEDLQQLKSQIS